MLERIVKFYPAFDKRDSDPKKDYGIHCVDLLMLVKGEKGAVQFRLFTGWYLSHLDQKSEPAPADLGYHSLKPIYEDQTPISENCEWLNAPCYYDGSGLNAQRVFDVLLKEGSDGVWRELEEYYNEVF